jgi:hypothetical protein
MTTATNRELFLAESTKIVNEAVRHGSSMSRIRALRNYMAERLTGSTKATADGIKASLIGEMFSTNADIAAAILIFAKEKAKYHGADCGDAMAAIAVDHGIYSATSEIWRSIAMRLTASKKTQKDYIDLVRSLRAELRSVADKANGQMNAILEEFGVKEKPTGKKGRKAAEKKAEEAKADAPAESVASPVETVVKLDSGLTPIGQIAAWLLDGTVDLLELADLVVSAAVQSNQEWTESVFTNETIENTLIQLSQPVAA